MEPDAEQSFSSEPSGDVPAFTSSTQTADAESAPVLGDPQFQGVIPILALAILTSLLVRRIGKSGAATHLRRWLPLVHSGVWAAAILAVTWIYARGLSSPWILAIWLLFLVFAFASVGWLRSVMSGVALSVEGRIRVGDSIRLGSVEGEVVAFGMRAVRLRAVDGTILEIPNEKLVTDTVANLTGDGGDSACELIIAVPHTIDPEDALQLARKIAVLTPLASPRHRPEVFLLAHHTGEQHYDLRIRGYAYDAAYQDHFRSDVISRLQAAFARQTHIREATHDPTSALLLFED